MFSAEPCVALVQGGLAVAIRIELNVTAAEEALVCGGPALPGATACLVSGAIIMSLSTAWKLMLVGRPLRRGPDC